MDIYKKYMRPLLFRFDAENVHNLAKSVLQRHQLIRTLAGDAMLVRDERLHVDLGGLRIENPVGLGAGFDKDCEMVDGLMRLGFGYVVTGSVMFNPSPGNPRPRMVRDPEREALFSCMGLPSKGLDYVVRRLKSRNQGLVPLIINFNAMDLKEYLKCFEVLQPLGDAIEISLFCPNRVGDEGYFLDPNSAGTLFEEIAVRKKKPLFFKILGYASKKERERRLDLIDRAIKYPVEGITITPESRVKEKRLSIGQGTLTGKPKFPGALEMVQDVYEIAKDNCHIKASGGISSPEDAFNIIAAGASTVEIVTGFMYEGWRLAQNINHGLVNLMDKYNIKDVTALRGTRLKIDHTGALE
ncbi:MAG: dihydroorotate dehydrogenase 2 [Desulfatiglandales bacterium]|jgi:dihydroorotate dehydrogenase|nr:dihydroorotate dehydrogenase 2 [Desulfatiglandales bacterium]